MSSAVCNTCRGRGTVVWTPTGLCPACGGHGWIVTATCRT